jgi:hypothetical protein
LAANAAAVAAAAAAAVVAAASAVANVVEAEDEAEFGFAAAGASATEVDDDDKDDDDDASGGVAASAVRDTLDRCGNASPRPGNEATDMGSGNGAAATAATLDFLGATADDDDEVADADGPTGV